MALAKPPPLDERVDLAFSSGYSKVTKRHGGVTVGQLGIDVTLQGGQRALTVESIDIVPGTPRSTPPLDGALLCSVGQGDAARVKLAANMDRPAPYLYDEGTPSRPHFRDKVISLAPHEQVSVQVFFQSERGTRRFELIARYTLDGKRKTMAIPPPSGNTYAVTAPSDSYRLGYKYTPSGADQMNDREMCELSHARKSC